MTCLTNYKVNITLNIPPSAGILSVGFLTDVSLTNSQGKNALL